MLATVKPARAIKYPMGRPSRRRSPPRQPLQSQTEAATLSFGAVAIAAIVMRYPISNVQDIYDNSLLGELHHIFKVFYWLARLHGSAENLRSLGENTGLYQARILRIIVADLSGISGRHPTRTAGVGSFHEDWTSVYTVSHRSVPPAKTRIHTRYRDLLLEKITMSLVNLRVSTMDGGAGTSRKSHHSAQATTTAPRPTSTGNIVVLQG